VETIIADFAAENETMQAEISRHAGSAKLGSSPSLRRIVSCYLELAKARLASLVVLTAGVGYVLGTRGGVDLTTLMWTAVGTALSAFGANILNQVLEEDRDRRMERTRSRPLPAGRIGVRTATAWGVASALLGLLVLAVATNWLTTSLSLFVILLYVSVYTPLKVRTPLNTVVGAVCGAVPPMMGWTAASGRLELGAWVLFGVLFVWQMPHFLSLAWLYRSDYRRGGFRMLPEVDRSGRITGRLALLYAASLLPVTAALSWIGVSGTTFLMTSQLLGLAFAAIGWQFLNQRSDATARRLFLASIAYLPLLLSLMVIDRGGGVGRAEHERRGRVAATASAPSGSVPESTAEL
jgi:protoheme IX farnesyltransferase